MTTRKPGRSLKAVDRATTAAIVREDEDKLARQAFELRLKGRSWWAIAEELQVTESKARGLLDRAIQVASDLVSAHAKTQILAMELERLDALHEAHWTRATEGYSGYDKDGNEVEIGPDVRAGEFILKVAQQRARLLGLEDANAGTTHTTVVVGGTSPEYIEALRRIADNTVLGEVV